MTGSSPCFSQKWNFFFLNQLFTDTDFFFLYNLRGKLITENWFIFLKDKNIFTRKMVMTRYGDMCACVSVCLCVRYFIVVVDLCLFLSLCRFFFLNPKKLTHQSSNFEQRSVTRWHIVEEKLPSFLATKPYTIH